MLTYATAPSATQQHPCWSMGSRQISPPQLGSHVHNSTETTRIISCLRNSRSRPNHTLGNALVLCTTLLLRDHLDVWRPSACELHVMNWPPAPAGSDPALRQQLVIASPHGPQKHPRWLETMWRLHGLEQSHHPRQVPHSPFAGLYCYGARSQGLLTHWPSKSVLPNPCCSRRRTKDGSDYSFWSLRIPSHALWPPKCSSDISTLHGRSSSGSTLLLLRLHYIEDILVASATPEEHLEHLRMVFERLEKYGLVINVTKSHFGVAEL